MINLCLGIAIILMASAVCKYIANRGKADVPGQAEQRLMGGMRELERRLNDVQDVMITIDEKLSRPGVRV
jgi:hypothetical protein